MDHEPDHNREIIALEALMVLSDAPYVLFDYAAVAAISRHSNRQTSSSRDQ